MRAQGHEAYSCDIQDQSGGHPEWHIKGDALKAIYSQSWDLLIAHPPCTYIANSGVPWLHKDASRWQKLDEACEFFRAILSAPIERIAVENPIPHKYAVERIGRKYDQLIQPYQFGHMETKATCFWLKGLPKLVHTSNLKAETMALPYKVRNRLHWLPPSPDRAKIRSKTYSGIAEAIAKQWA